MVKQYTNGETTVVWQPAKCLHTGVCLRGLPKVFSLARRPWVEMTGATTAEIEEMVFKCPSRALTIEGKEDQAYQGTHGQAEVVLTPGGPLTIYGPTQVKDLKGKTLDEKNTVSFCRCGRTKNPPYCDASHMELLKEKKQPRAQ